jgi:hypothetical protein
MLSGIAKRTNAMTNQRVCPVDAKWEPYWDTLWDGLPFMQKQMTLDCAVLRNGPSVRHYYSGMKDNRILWRKWDIAPGEIRLTDEEREWAANETRLFGERFIVTESRHKEKGGGGANKQWPHWQEFFDRRIEIGVPHRVLFYEMREAPTFRHACAILERSIGYVGHEGGLHHAAAALGKRAVVVFGGYISPDVTGYANHKNLYVAADKYPLGCGTVTPCDHCRAAMEVISVEQVVEAVREMVSDAG